MRLLIIIFCTLFLSCEFWYDFMNCGCTIKEFGQLYCIDNEKRVCNFNAKLELLDTLKKFKLDCHTYGLHCNPYNDGGWCIGDEDHIVSFFNITDYEMDMSIFILKMTGNYWINKCCIPYDKLLELENQHANIYN